MSFGGHIFYFVTRFRFQGFRVLKTVASYRLPVSRVLDNKKFPETCNLEPETCILFFYLCLVSCILLPFTLPSHYLIECKPITYAQKNPEDHWNIPWRFIGDPVC